jgi:hypothetical protein
MTWKGRMKCRILGLLLSLRRREEEERLPAHQH